MGKWIKDLMIIWYDDFELEIKSLLISADILKKSKHAATYSISYSVYYLVFNIYCDVAL